MPVPLATGADGTIFAVRVVPRSGRTGVAGMRGDAVVVRLAAPPVDGAANDALIAFVAELFDRPRRDVTLVSGHTGRNKRVAVAGLPQDQVAARLLAILAACPP